MTKYVVLSTIGGGEFMEHSRVEASSAAGAIRLVAKDDGRYVAVPESSFSVYDVQAETPKPRLVLTPVE